MNSVLRTDQALHSKSKHEDWKLGCRGISINKSKHMESERLCTILFQSAKCWKQRALIVWKKHVNICFVRNRVTSAHCESKVFEMSQVAVRSSLRLLMRFLNSAHCAQLRCAYDVARRFWHVVVRVERLRRRCSQWSLRIFIMIARTCLTIML